MTNERESAGPNWGSARASTLATSKRPPSWKRTLPRTASSKANPDVTCVVVLRQERFLTERREVEADGLEAERSLEGADPVVDRIDAPFQPRFLNTVPGTVPSNSVCS